MLMNTNMLPPFFAELALPTRPEPEGDSAPAPMVHSLFMFSLDPELVVQYRLVNWKRDM